MANTSGIDTVSTRFFDFGDGPGGAFRFQNGTELPGLRLAYETYGTLAPAHDNAVLVFHAMSGSAHAAGINTTPPGTNPLWTDECHAGWWDGFIGPGKAIDTDEFFVICANYIGGCYGSTGPSSINPETGKPFGGSFPMITISDIVDTQMALLNHLGIRTLHAAIGPSIGGMLVLNLATRYPDRVTNIIPMSSSMKVSTLQRILNFEQIYAIEEDPHFNGGNYYGGPYPDKGLALARMIAHKTYISLDTLERRASGEILQREPALRAYELSSPIESYMLHQGEKFVQRFDANSYLRIIAAWQLYDLLYDAGASTIKELFAPCKHQNALIFSIDTDVCYYPEEQAILAANMREAGITCQHITAHSKKGHDSFLLEPELFSPHIDYLLKGKHS